MCVVAGIIKVGGRVVVVGVVAREWGGMCCVEVVIWSVYCVCGCLSAVGGDGRVGWVERCARGQYRCRYMPPVAMSWVHGGMF